jgi:hypothetical protein
MSDKAASARLRVWLTGLLGSDWIGLPGTLWRQFTESASGITKVLDLRQSLEDVSELAGNWVEGEATSKQAAAVKAFAEEEKAKIDTELQRRALPADLRRREAEASKAEIEAERERAALNVDLRKRSAEAEKAEAEARIARLQEQQLRLQVQNAITEFIAKQKDAGLVILVSDSRVYVNTAPPNFNWERYAHELTSSAGLYAHELTTAAGLSFENVSQQEPNLVPGEADSGIGVERWVEQQTQANQQGHAKKPPP